MTRAQDADSLPNQLLRLGFGECFTLSQRLNDGEVGYGMIAGMTDSLRNSMESAIRRAKIAMPGSAFVAESGKFFTRKNDVIVCVVATRIA